MVRLVHKSSILRVREASLGPRVRCDVKLESKGSVTVVKALILAIAGTDMVRKLLRGRVRGQTCRKDLAQGVVVERRIGDVLDQDGSDLV
jgi:hypothetical protein